MVPTLKRGEPRLSRRILIRSGLFPSRCPSPLVSMSTIKYSASPLPPVRIVQGMVLNVRDEMLSGLLLEDAIVHNAIHKMQNPIDKMFFLGFIAGIWLGLAGIAATMVAGGIPIEVRQQWPTLPKIGSAFFFPFAIHFITLFGGELVTGNFMILSIGIWNRSIPWTRALVNLVILWIANFLACLTCAVLFSYKTELFVAEPYLSYVREVANTKTNGYSWINLFLRAIPANALVCMAVMFGFATRDSAGKIMALWFPVMIFAVSGFEHAVANMFFISNGLLYDSPTTIGRLFFNQSAVLLGNFVGAIVIGTTEHAMNHWNSPVPFERGHAAGTLAAGDVESTRKAKEDRPTDEKQQMKDLVRTRSRIIVQRKERSWCW
ncbi:Formate/nitrite transporter-domain-containing protein [Crepidotus variabilis]|uniref:Formate/nitrite transporter-domain-containing protein n=1 Tax=Crepidotus variabilis TaxID=179855 RepID=A0A9P6ER73_9AGAR|nr:Formate/nitrite transporter-domain-containing protein [Crepidotus variabilis]